MEHRRIGSLSVSVVGLGCNNFGGRLDYARSEAVIHAALDAGINLLDTADMYGGTKSEEYIGTALGSRRDEVVLATKFGWRLDEDHPGGASAGYIRSAVEDSLRRLKTDRIDLYQLHLPDAATPMEETLAALDELVRAGKVREIGCSNFSVEQLQEAERAARPGSARYVSVQNDYSLLKRDPEAGVLAECERQGLGFLPFFPLASGMLTGKYRRGAPAPEGTRLAAEAAAGRFRTDANVAATEALISFAEARGRSILELAFSWLLSRPVVSSVIAGATRPEQIQANIAATGWRLTADDLAAVDSLTPSSAASE